MRRYPITIAFVLVLTLFAGLAYAQSYDVAASLNAIRADRDAGILTRDQAALYTAYALFDVVKLPNAYYREFTDTRALAGAGPHWFCGTSAVIALREAMPTLSPEVRAIIERYLPPIQERRVVRRESKVKQDFNFIDQFGNPVYLPYSYKTGYFAIRWGDSYTPDMDMIENWGNVMDDEIWQTVINDWGYQPITGTDTYYLNLYVGSSGSGAPTIDWDGAYTTIFEDPDTHDYMPVIVVSQSIISSLDALREVCSHEFYHTTQFTHALTDGCWSYMGETETWFVEGTATWAEHRVYPQFTGYTYYIYDWAQNPEHPLTDNSYMTAAPYARVIWGLYLDEHLDGLDTVYEIWNGCYSNGTIYGCNAYLEDNGKTWGPTYLDFMAAVVLKDFVDGNDIPTFNIMKRIQTYPFVQKTVPDSSKPYVNGMNLYELRVGNDTDPRVNIRFVGGDLNSTRKEWALGVLKTTSGGDAELQVIELTDGAGTVTIDGLGTTYNKMYALISPVTGKITDSVNRYDYLFEITRGDDPFPTDDDTADDDATDDDDAGDDDIGDDDAGSSDCKTFCERVTYCNLLDDLNLTADNCLEQCQQINATALECVLEAQSCDDTAQCVGVSTGGGDDDDSGGACGF